MLAILCSSIALLHYPIDKDITGLLIGLALLSSGVTDALPSPNFIGLPGSGPDDRPFSARAAAFDKIELIL